MAEDKWTTKLYVSMVAIHYSNETDKKVKNKCKTHCGQRG